MQTLQTFARNLRYLRKQKKLTQQQVAKALFVSRSTYSYYEKNRIQFPAEKLLLVCELYNYRDIHALLSQPLQDAA